MAGVERIAKPVLQFYGWLNSLFLTPVLFLEWKRPPRSAMKERFIEYGFALLVPFILEAGTVALTVTILCKTQ